MTIRVVGLELVVRHLNNLSGAMKALANLQGSIGTDVPYAESVILGARPHVIRARNARALFWPGARHPVASVNHPGNAPNPFIRDVFMARRDDIVASIALGIGLATQDSDWSAAGPFGIEIDRITEEVRAAAPVRSGRLRRSLHSEFRQGRSGG